MATETQVVEKTENDVAVIEAETNAAEKVEPKKTDFKSAVKIIPYFTDAKVVCVCGNTFTTGSTKAEIRVEICSNCHPYFTGQEKFVDTEGRVERFKRLEDAKKDTKSKKEVERKPDQPKTLKEMLLSMSEK